MLDRLSGLLSQVEAVGVALVPVASVLVAAFDHCSAAGAVIAIARSIAVSVLLVQLSSLVPAVAGTVVVNLAIDWNTV